jgi:hypothetical protein
MTPKNALSASDFGKIRGLDTCTVLNAIERFNVRVHNEAFVHGSVHYRYESPWKRADSVDKETL